MYIVPRTLNNSDSSAYEVQYIVHVEEQRLYGTCYSHGYVAIPLHTAYPACRSYNQGARVMVMHSRLSV